MSSDNDAEDGKEEGRVVKSNLMRGMKIRDEFICPITYELMREPVVASDGHTYEKHAIEKWLKTNHTSPRSGDSMEALIIPNMNLKKLIQDIINEGGAGFYTSDMSNKDRLFEVCPEKVLILDCLGPPESDWNQQSFQVTKFGCVGGRKHNPEDSSNLREIVLFKDITVSRRHFEITQQPSPPTPSPSTPSGVQQPQPGNKSFFLRDLGSAGGTFVRIKFGSRKQLHPGMIILLGKHQFTVSSIDDMGHPVGGAAAAADTRKSFSAGGTSSGVTRKSMLNSDVIMSIVENAERIIADFSRDGHEQVQGPGEERRQKDELSARLKYLTAELSHLQLAADPIDGSPVPMPMALDDPIAMGMGHPDTPNEFKRSAPGDRDRDRAADSKEAFHSRNQALDATSAQLLDRDSKGTLTAADSKGSDLDRMATATGTPSGARRSLLMKRRCTLTCCAPDGSPLQGMSFAVGPEGAMMGRKHSNPIALYMKITDPATGEERIANVDTAISSEHARVEFDERTGDFTISDGTASKPSTNGTWFRLSGPHQESPPHLLQGGAEVLIGTVRFVVKESMTISERKVVSHGQGHGHGHGAGEELQDSNNTYKEDK